MLMNNLLERDSWLCDAPPLAVPFFCMSVWLSGHHFLCSRIGVARTGTLHWGESDGELSVLIKVIHRHGPPLEGGFRGGRNLVLLRQSFELLCPIDIQGLQGLDVIAPETTLHQLRSEEEVVLRAKKERSEKQCEAR